eukprot:TRINITY_DN58024_c0_g1_i1.p1 TRINITY_DN58024_c0_g1~~TRINITY_DN58024_c0_g1_i1.p1  ORF type:complete len:201 (-),score=43.04 TRINITY_DN58024_c0_g1_i1:182-718(-)
MQLSAVAMFAALAFSPALSQDWPSASARRVRHQQRELVAHRTQGITDAHNAREAAQVAVDASAMATEVVRQSGDAAERIHEAVADAHAALKETHSVSVGLLPAQQRALEQAEANVATMEKEMRTLREEVARVGKSDATKRTDALDDELLELQRKLKDLDAIAVKQNGTTSGLRGATTM